ncbi:MAG TPA: aldo/keto reductase, partial [Trebonia sp.]|nr:aldo/keto reductase [Trebonia sp.]
MRTSPPGLGLGLYRARPTRDLIETALDAGIRHIDTASSYHRFTGHHDLAAAAGELLTEFTVSTKVGFFPGGRHSLDPRELARAAERCRDDLGFPPGLVLLHNPECSFQNIDPASARRSLAASCAALAEAAAEGVCAGWGISTWDAAGILEAAAGLAGQIRPDVLMIRSGLTVSARQLGAARVLIQALRPGAAWGMSPFGGAARDPVWTNVSTTQFLRAGHHSSPHQAGLRVACELPPVDLVVAGTSDRDHLRQLAEAIRLP